MTIRQRISDAEWQARLDLAACYRLVHHHRMSDLLASHISSRIPGREGRLLINQFGTLFNHAISLKSLVTLATITGNTFEACGRTCIELGQDSPACGTALVSGNTFKGARLLDVNINNIGTATVTDNIFYATATKFLIQPKSPDTRVITTSPNTLQ